MARDLIAGAPLNRRQHLADESAGHGGDGAAALAADVLVMLPGDLVSRLAVVELHPLDRSLLLQTGQGAKHRREVRFRAPAVEGGSQLVDRPPVPGALGEQVEDRWPDVAGTGDRPILAITQVACETAYGR
jgi:hypothetical protein